MSAKGFGDVVAQLKGLPAFGWFDAGAAWPGFGFEGAAAEAFGGLVSGVNFHGDQVLLEAAVHLGFFQNIYFGVGKWFERPA